MRQNSKTKSKAVSSVASEFVRTAMRRSSRNKVFAVIAVAVAAFTVFALAQPAVTLTYDCGMDEHVHTEECYTGELVCDNQEPDHEHTDACYSKHLSCAAPEHVHSEGCTASTDQGKNQNQKPAGGVSDPGADSKDQGSEEPRANIDEPADSAAADERLLAGNELAGKSFVLYSKDNNAVMLPELLKSGLSWKLLGATPYSYELDANGGHHLSLPEGIGAEWTFVEKNGLHLAYIDVKSGEIRYLTFRGSSMQLDFSSTPDRMVSTKQYGDGTLGLSFNYLGREWPMQMEGTGMSNVQFSGDPTHFILIPSENVTYESSLVQGMTPPGTQVNLFDYWATSERVVSAGDQSNNHSDQGINAGHSFKFSNGSEPLGDEDYNEYTGRGVGLYQGIVANTLSDSYPKLKNGSKESLNYLFDPSIYIKDGKLSFSNIGGLFQKDKDGYYVYDCTRNYARLDESTGQMVLYRKPGVTDENSEGQFFPFNEFAEKSESAKMNHHFGMSLSAKFVQRNEGYIDVHKQKPMSFEFSGDDDVWIFIDGVLVADLGGIHDRADVTIDFSTGVVTTKCGKTYSTTLKQQYEAAGREGATSWRIDTYADNTYHTLEFFYLERGAHASNLKLKYNLTSVPETVVEKVDQYGRGINGACFAVYAADNTYGYLDQKGGKPVALREGEYSFNDEGDIVGTDGNILVNALYKGTTRGGKMVFSSPSGGAYTLAELKELFGDHFILREYKVPDGYRITGEETHLKIDEGNLLICENSYENGSYAAANLIATATNDIWIDDRDGRYEGDSTVGAPYKKVTYYDPVNKTTKGTLFAVAMKYDGPALKPEDITGLGNEDNWNPVYGSAATGYTVVENKTGEQAKLIERSIKAAQQAIAHGQVAFEMTPSGRMEMNLQNLPGEITSYYYTLDESEKERTKFSIAYYWTSAKSVEDAKADNTWLVSADARAPEGNPGFERVFGSVVSVPNVYNRLLVQKKSNSKDGAPLNGARFALYPVQEDEHTDGTAGTIHYMSATGKKIAIGSDGSASVGSDSSYTYGIDEKSGEIHIYKEGKEIEDLLIAPAKNVAGALLVGETSSKPNGLTEDGIMSFEGLRQGKYALREIAAPAGHALSNTESLVMVTRDAVYACAGTATDGIRVGNGPGYIVDTMREFATDGDVNTTLLWITTMLRGYRSKDGSYSFNDFYRGDSEWPFMMDETGKPVPFVGASRDARRAAMRAYLKYDLALTDDPRHSYSVDSDDEYEQHDSNAYGTGAQVKTPRLYTEVGWSTLEVYQDYWFGSRQMDGKNAEYTMLHKEGVMRDPNLVKLFSRSATVEFSDQQVSNLKVSKKVRDAASVGGEQQFTFNFALNDQKGAPIIDDYAYRVFETVGDKPVVDENGAQIGGRISSGKAFSIKNGQYALITGLPASALVTISEVGADDYGTTHSVNGGDPATGKQAKGVSLKWEVATAGAVDNTTTIHFVNSFPQPVDIALEKCDASLILS